MIFPEEREKEGKNWEKRETIWRWRYTDTYRLPYGEYRWLIKALTSPYSYFISELHFTLFFDHNNHDSTTASQSHATGILKQQSIERCHLFFLYPQWRGVWELVLLILRAVGGCLHSCHHGIRSIAYLIDRIDTKFCYLSIPLYERGA